MKTIGDIRIQLRDRFIKFYTDDLVKISRKRRANMIFKIKHLDSPALSASQRDEILSFWKPYCNVAKELRWFEFYNRFCEDKSQLKYYIPDIFYYRDVDFCLTDPRRSDALDDKNLYDLYFHDVKVPCTIVRKVAGELLDKDYQPVTVEKALQLCADAGQVVCKEARFSMGGHGVHFVDFAKSSLEDFKQWLASSDNINVQTIIRQHECLNQIHANSVNSVRIMTCLLDGEVRILSSILRMGRDGARVDNASSGGIFCGINDDGTLKEWAYDTRGNRWAQHPQGAVFKGIKIEGYHEARELVKKLAGRLGTTSRLISWDLAIDEDGHPVVIEVNLTYGELDFHQICNGPLFGNMTEKVLSLVYSSKK